MSAKKLLRSAWFVAARMSGGLAAREKELAAGLTVLMYHRVLPEERCARYPLRSLAMPEAAFRAQMRWLARNTEVVTVSQALERVAAGMLGPRPLVAVTFDDGYADNARAAAAILEECGLRATFFVTTSFVAEKAPFWFDRASCSFVRLDEGSRAMLGSEFGSEAPNAAERAIGPWMTWAKRLAPADRARMVARAEALSRATFDATEFEPMRPDEVLRLARAGHEVGSHATTHGILTQLSDVELARELGDAKHKLETWAEATVNGLAYPNGSVDVRVATAARAAGHAWAVGTAPGLHSKGDDPFTIRRVAIAQDRVLDAFRRPEELAFRAELARLRGDGGGTYA